MDSELKDLLTRFEELQRDWPHGVEYFTELGRILQQASQKSPLAGSDLWARALAEYRDAEEAKRAEFVLNTLAFMRAGEDTDCAVRTLAMDPDRMRLAITGVFSQPGAGATIPLSRLVAAAMGGVGAPEFRHALLGMLGSLDESRSAQAVHLLVETIWQLSLLMQEPHDDEFVRDMIQAFSGKAQALARIHLHLRGLLENEDVSKLLALATEHHLGSEFLQLLCGVASDLGERNASRLWAKYLRGMTDPDAQLPQCGRDPRTCVAAAHLIKIDDEVLPWYFKRPGRLSAATAKIWLEEEDIDRFEKYVSMLASGTVTDAEREAFMAILYAGVQRCLHPVDPACKADKRRFAKALSTIAENVPDGPLHDSVAQLAERFSLASQGDLAARRSMEPTEQLRELARRALASGRTDDPFHEERTRIMATMEGRLVERARNALPGGPRSFFMPDELNRTLAPMRQDQMRQLAMDDDIARYLFSCVPSAGLLRQEMVLGLARTRQVERAADLIRICVQTDQTASDARTDRQPRSRMRWGHATERLLRGMISSMEAMAEDEADSMDPLELREIVLAILDDVWMNLPKPLRARMDRSRMALVGPDQYDTTYIPWLLRRIEEAGSAPLICRSLAGILQTAVTRFLQVDRLDAISTVVHAAANAVPDLVSSTLTSVMELASREQMATLIHSWPSLFAAAATCEPLPYVANDHLRMYRSLAAMRFTPDEYRLFDHVICHPDLYLAAMEDEPAELGWGQLPAPQPLCSTATARIGLEHSELEADSRVRALRIHLLVSPKGDVPIAARCTRVALDGGDVTAYAVWEWERPSKGAPGGPNSLVGSMRISDAVLQEGKIHPFEKMETTLVLRTGHSSMVDMVRLVLQWDDADGAFRVAQDRQGA